MTKACDLCGERPTKLFARLVAGVLLLLCRRCKPKAIK